MDRKCLIILSGAEAGTSGSNNHTDIQESLKSGILPIATFYVPTYATDFMEKYAVYSKPECVQIRCDIFVPSCPG